MDLTIYFKSKVIEGSHKGKGKKLFFNFWALLLKMYIFWGCDFFLSPSGYPVMIHVFDFHVFEVFFLLTKRMPLVTKLFRVVTCCEELSPINIHDIWTEWSGVVKWQIKHISPPPGAASISHWTRCWLSVRGSQTWPFDQVTNLRSNDCLKPDWNLLFHEVYS